MKYKIYFKNGKCKVLNYTPHMIEAEPEPLPYIDLQYYVQLKETINWVNSYVWQYRIYNGSDRTIYLDYYMEISDSSSIMEEDSDSGVGIAPGDVYYLELEADSLISGCYLNLSIYADNAKGFDYEDGYH